jgi:hypothetical protein
MIREYDLFEKFPDGSSLWRASIRGLVGTQLYLRALAEKSGNQFYAIDMSSGKIVHDSPGRSVADLLANTRLAKRSKSAAA